MKRRMSVASVMGLLCWLVFSVSASAATSATFTAMDRAGLIRSLGPDTIALDTSKNPLQQLFADSRLVINGGFGKGGACTSNYPLNLSPGEAPVALLVVAVNPRTCKQILQLGHLSAVPPSAPSAVGTTANSSTANTSLALAAATSARRVAHFYTTWHDPIFINLVEVMDRVDWYYDGAHVSGCSGSDYRWWLSDDGWRETAHSGPYLAYENNSTQCRVWTPNTTYYNQPFCGGTGIGFNPNNVYGKSNGTASGWVNTWAWGCDTNYISYGTYLDWG